MSDVKKFIGYIAVDRSTHTNLKAATEHSRAVKVKAALSAGFGDQLVSPSIVTDQELENNPQLVQNLDQFIYNNRDAILACLNQEVTTRKARTPKAKPAATDAAAKEPQPVAA